MLSNIFLGRVDRNIEGNVCGLAKNISHYVDDFVIIVEYVELNVEGLLNVLG